MTPKISVITPVYNVEEYLPRCLRSLHAQTLDDIEFICVNDGSTDGSLAILRDFAARDGRFVVIDKPNGGYGHTMNTGLDAAQGEYVGIVESDDFIEPCAFEKLFALAVENGGCDIVKANHYAHSDDGEPALVENFPPDICGHPLTPLDEDGQAVLNSIPAIWAAIYRREFLERCRIRFLETPGAAFQDTGFVFKAWIASDAFYLTHEAYLHYRIDNANSSVKSPAKALYVCDEFASIEAFLDERPARRQKLARRVAAKKFDTYLWNYDRIDWRFRRDFLDIVAAEFTLALKRGDIEKALYAPDEWQRLTAIANDPQAVFDNDRKGESASAGQTGQAGLPAQLPRCTRDAAQAVANAARRLSPRVSKRPEGAEDKLVSIVIPVYNAEPYLDKLFDSLLAQTHEALEIICVNDCSTDSSLRKLEGYAAADPRVQVLDIQGGGAGAARNAGIERASGDYLCFVDADDFVECDTFARLVDLACAHDLDVVIYGIDEYADDTHARKKMEHAVVEGKVPAGEVFCPRDVENLFVNMTGFTVNKLYEMGYFKKLGVRFPAIGAHEDMPFTYAAVAAAERAYYLDKVLYHYRLERKGSRSESTEKQFAYMLEALACMRDELKRLGLWEPYERDFVNYALSVCRWKFESLQGNVRHAYYDALTDGGWLANLDIPNHESSYFHEARDRRFFCRISTESYLEMIEEENRWLKDEVKETLESRTFRLGSLFARPVQTARKRLLGADR